MGRKTTQAPERIFIRPEVGLTCRHCTHYDNDDCPTIRGKFVPYPVYPCDEFDRNDYPLYGEWNDKKFLLEHVEYRAVKQAPEADTDGVAITKSIDYVDGIPDGGTREHPWNEHDVERGYQVGFRDGIAYERERMMKGAAVVDLDAEIDRKVQELHTAPCYNELAAFARHFVAVGATMDAKKKRVTMSGFYSPISPNRLVNIPDLANKGALFQDAGFVPGEPVEITIEAHNPKHK